MFGFFGSKKKKEEGIGNMLSEFMIYQQIIGHIGKAQSLQKLSRAAEAQEVLIEAERLATNFLKQNPRDKKAHMVLVLFYSEVGAFERAETIIQKLLASVEFELNDGERLALSAELQKINRQRPADQRSPDAPKSYTQIYCCANCGRLHNFVSMPCPHCDWAPQTIDEMARSVILSNSHFKVSTLLTLAREIGKGRVANDVVPNLVADGKNYLANPSKRQGIEQVFSLLHQNAHKNHRSLNMIRECPACCNRILFSSEEECEKCGQPVSWPDAIRTLVCMDNLLWLLEQRVEASSTDAFSDFVCLLIAMTNNLLRKQEAPSSKDRHYALKLLSDMAAISDLNNGAMIDTQNPKELQIYLFKDKMREDSESFGLFLYKELEFFVEKMTNGIHL